jgi:hypothetical protein
MDAIREMGGINVNLNQNAEKVCYNLISKAKQNKIKDENMKKFKISLECF